MQAKDEERSLDRVGRFAPAPTGDIHVGHLWTCYFNFVLSDRVVLRIDNTNCHDLHTCHDFLRETFGLLRLFGFRFFKVVVQGLRADRYRSWAYSNLKDRTYLKDGALYFEMSGTRSSFHDSFRRRDITKLLEKDPVLIRSDGNPTYHLASIYDDNIDGITDIIRSSDHIDSTLVHSVIFDSIGISKRFWIVPLIYNENGEKLSKSKGNAPSIRELLGDGILPQALLNYFDLHRNSVRPFRFDRKILMGQNHKCMRYDNILKAMDNGLGHFHDVGTMGIRRLVYFRDLIDKGRYRNMNQLIEEMDSLLPGLTSVLDSYRKGSLDEYWLSVLDSWFNDGILVPLTVQDKINFRENLLRISKGPSIEDCFGILSLICKEEKGDDYEEEGHKIQE